MKWQDMVSERPLSDQEIVTGLSCTFRLNTSEIMVSRKLDNFVNPCDAKLVCIASQRNDGFRCILSIYAYFDASGLDEMTVVTGFARACNTELLISDDSPNPYTMIRVLPIGDVVSVKLDVDRLDDKDEYHIRE